MPTYPLEASEELWEDWKLTVPRSYDRLGDRVIELIESDLACQNDHGTGVVELLEQEGYIDSDDLGGND